MKSRQDIHSSFHKEIVDLRSELSSDPGGEISREKLARLLDVSLATVSRWETEISNPDPKNTSKIERLRRALDALDDLILRRDRFRFFNERHPVLKQRPIDMLGTEDGADLVLEFIESLKSPPFQ